MLYPVQKLNIKTNNTNKRAGFISLLPRFKCGKTCTSNFSLTKKIKHRKKGVKWMFYEKFEMLPRKFLKCSPILTKSDSTTSELK